MSKQDMELAGKVSEVASHFPEVWREYQDWLRDIVSSRSVLLQQYPVWRAVLIFRWRLLYFVVYVAAVILFNPLLDKLKRLYTAIGALQAEILSEKEAMVAGRSKTLATQTPSFDWYHYILQRMATLLAVVELTLCGMAALTGILLAFYYQPAAMGAYESLTTIVYDIASGALIFSLHHVAGNGLIVLALLQIVVMFLGREFLLSWLTGWISGVVLALTAIGLGWTAIVLSWEQISFWQFNLELNIVGSIPLVGSMLQEILSGGDSISSITLQHMYALHSYLLAIAAILLSLIHLTALICQEQTWKPAEKRFRLAKLCGGAAPHSDAPSA